MIHIDAVSNRETQEVLGFEIGIDDKVFFISTDQENYPEIQTGNFPELTPLVLIPLRRVDTKGNGSASDDH